MYWKRNGRNVGKFSSSTEPKMNTIELYQGHNKNEKLDNDQTERVELSCFSIF